MKYITAVRGESKDDEGKYSFRIVFKLAHGYVVYKGFAESESVWTVKYWNTSDLDKTMSFWNTRKEFEPSTEQIKLAKSRIRQAGKDISFSN